MIMREYAELVDTKCKKCGKNFIPAPFHIYADRDGAYCSYHCYNARDVRPKGRCKPVEQYSEDGTILLNAYPSASVAALRTNLGIEGIRRSCTKSVKYRGYLWKYKTKEKEKEQNK